MTHQITCIRRTGLELIHTEGADFAAKVTCLAFERGKVYDPRDGVRQEWLVPKHNYWGE